ncbi:hypothetical protein [Arthrobacter sp. N1]|uniref:hypothetical protein n=1 Tax=Arthrobacter sp. N1 TaxID=619291 RepID=UPI003BAEDB9C
MNPAPLGYSPGEWLCLVRHGLVAVVPRSTPVEDLERLWQALLPGVSLGHLLPVAARGLGAGLDAVPPFALLAVGEDLHVMLRGPFALTTGEQGAETARVAGGGRITTWTESVIEGGGRGAFELACGEAVPPGPLYPMESGMVLASVIRGGTRVPGTPDVVRVSGADGVSGSPAREAVVPVTRPPAADPPRPTDPVPVRPARPVKTLIDSIPWLRADAEGAGSGASDARTTDDGTAAAARPADAGVRTTDDGTAVAARPADADTDADADADGPRSAPIPAGMSDHDGDTIMGPPSPDVDSDQADERIPEVPAPAVPVSAAPVPEAPGEAEGRRPTAPQAVGDADSADTIVRPGAAGPDAQERSLRSPSSPGTGPLVVARLCRQGHANAPTRTVCSHCGSGLNDETEQVRRPSLGQVRLSTGEVFELDRSLVFGRQPSVSRVAGREMPRLVQVPSGGGDISRSHVEVRLDGWHVLLCDLRATNGTLLLRAGQPPRRLGEGETAFLLDGDVAQLADDVSLRFEGLP